MKMTAQIESTGAVSLDIEGETSTEDHQSVADARRSIMNAARMLAAQTGTATNLEIEDPSGTRALVVQSDGQVVDRSVETLAFTAAQTWVPAPPTDPPTDEKVSVPSREHSEIIHGSAPQTTQERTALEAEIESVFGPQVGTAEEATVTGSHTQAPVAAVAVPTFTEGPLAPSRREPMPSFVTSPETPARATHGLRGILNQLGFRLAPSAEESAQREDEKLVARHWPGPRTIAVVNPKGGAGKTPTVICLSAVFARLGGSGVLAWDNNNSLGSLGWRTFDAGHKATVVDLLEQTERFMTANARAGDLSFYVHHQAADQYDVLRSDDRSGEQERHLVSGNEVDRLYAVAAKYYRLIVMDSGNTERGDNWQAMITHADQVVIPVKSVNDAAEGAARVLSALRAGNDHAQSLADRAVVIVLACEPSHEKSKLNELAESFRPFVRAVATVPYDGALVEGRIRFSAMAPRTRRAWLRAGAQIAGEL